MRPNAHSVPSTFPLFFFNCNTKMKHRKERKKVGFLVIFPSSCQFDCEYRATKQQSSLFAHFSLFHFLFNKLKLPRFSVFLFHFYYFLWRIQVALDSGIVIAINFLHLLRHFAAYFVIQAKSGQRNSFYLLHTHTLSLARAHSFVWKEISTCDYFLPISEVKEFFYNWLWL